MESRLEVASSFRSSIVFTFFSERCGDGEIPLGWIRLEPDAPAPLFALFFFFNVEAIPAVNPLRSKSNCTAGDPAGDGLLVAAAEADGGGGGDTRSVAADDFLVDRFFITRCFSILPCFWDWLWEVCWARGSYSGARFFKFEKVAEGEGYRHKPHYGRSMTDDCHKSIDFLYENNSC